MPYSTDKKALKDPFLDRRRKLLPCQEEMIKVYHKAGTSINQLSRDFKVNKRLIQFLLFPERKKKNVELRNDRGGSKIYYDRLEHNEAMNDHRRYKYKVLKDTN